MSTVELKQIITDHLTHIDDKQFLNALKTILESKISDNIYYLSDFQKKRIEQSRKEFREGKTISDNDLQKEIDQWLDSK
jgi:hypothetical protein